MNLYSNFKDKTWIDLISACKDRWINYWYIIESEEDIESSIEFDKEWFMKFYDALLLSYSKRHKGIPINNVMKAIDISMKNCLLTTSRLNSKHTWMSEHLFTDDDCINACTKYGDFALNPLVFIFDKTNFAKYQSILYGKKLNLVWLSVKNWNTYRHSRFFLQRYQVDRIDINRIDKMRYHPIVWHLLINGKLDEYKELYHNYLEKWEKKQKI